MRNLSYFLRFAVEVLIELFRFRRLDRSGRTVFIRQLIFTGYEALGLISLNALIIGCLIIIQGYSIFPQFSQSQIFFTIIVSVITRELGSIITALIIVARSGTAIASELGNMVLNNEVEALVSFGISPISYLVVPRTSAIVFSILPLSIYFSVVGFLSSGVAVYFFSGLPLDDFFLRLSAELQYKDIIANIVKATFFGFTIGLISCYHGLAVHSARTEVPQRTSKAVVHSVSAIIVLDIIITGLFYFA